VKEDSTARALPWEPVFILPSQLAPSRSHIPMPELQLVAAVLEDAVQCITRNMGARHGRRRREFVRACEWIWSDHRDWPFTFRNVCDLLDLDAGAIRRRIDELIAAHA